MKYIDELLRQLSEESREGIDLRPNVGATIQEVAPTPRHQRFQVSLINLC